MVASAKPLISWDSGTAYDLFTSLHILHHPERFGLRASWAAGVRSRLAAPQRSILEDAQLLFSSSLLTWVYGLPFPKDTKTALSSLVQIPTADRLPALAKHQDNRPEITAILRDVFVRRAWNEHDLELLLSHNSPEGGRVTRNELVTILNWWSQPEEFGERYLDAMQTYVSVFFAEEEQRIQPHLEQSLLFAQAQSIHLGFSDLFVELSKGVEIESLNDADEVTFIPSYWITPLVMYDCMVDQHWMVLFGARPSDISLVPGELVPDSLLLTLKALSDPTRLLILRYLGDEPHTPSQLAKKLRLRPPTVIHHLNALRLAGLVYVTLEEKQERRYAVRAAAVADNFEALNKFIAVPPKADI